MKVDNKKIAISLVVGVIALVVLIVGATYAYFSANNSASGTTTLEATAEEIGVVTVTNPTSNLYLRLSAVEMAEANQGMNYYATSINSDGYVYSGTEEYNSIANMKVTGGVTDTKYSCSFKINITKPSTIKSGDMSITFKTDDTIKPTISGVTSGTPIDLYSASSEYTASFEATGEHTSGYDIISTSIRLNNTTGDQSYLAGENLGVTITLSDIDCGVSKVEEETVASICTYDETSTVAEGTEGAKYNCKVDPNKDEYTFYLLDNNEDGTSDLIMNANINASEEAVIPGETSDTGMVAWYADEGNNIHGPVTAMTYLYNATKSWTNVEPLNYTYYDREIQGITDTTIGYESFVSTNGIGVITKGDTDSTQVTIGSTSEPLRARMPIYSSDASVTEVADKTDANSYLYDNFDQENYEYAPYGYWTLSSVTVYYRSARYMDYHGIINDNYVDIAGEYGVRPVITVKL